MPSQLKLCISLLVGVVSIVPEVKGAVCPTIDIANQTCTAEGPICKIGTFQLQKESSVCIEASRTMPGRTQIQLSVKTNPRYRMTVVLKGYELECQGGPPCSETLKITDVATPNNIPIDTSTDTETSRIVHDASNAIGITFNFASSNTQGIVKQDPLSPSMNKFEIVITPYDEDGKGDNCPDSLFRCCSGHCISNSLVDNGNINCPDGSDEYGLPKNKYLHCDARKMKVEMLRYQLGLGIGFGGPWVLTAILIVAYYRGKLCCKPANNRNRQYNHLDGDVVFVGGIAPRQWH